MKPSLQGSIDYFCGVYSVINAIKKSCAKIHKFSYNEECMLYQHLIQNLIDNNLISEVLHNGSSFDIMQLYLFEAKKYMLEKYQIKIIYHRPFLYKNEMVKNIIRYIGYWLKKSNTSFIIRIKNKVIGDHWTVVSKYMPIAKKLKLFDSYSYEDINVKYCRLKDFSTRTYMLKEGIILLKAYK